MLGGGQNRGGVGKNGKLTKNQRMQFCVCQPSSAIVSDPLTKNQRMPKPITLDPLSLSNSGGHLIQTVWNFPPQYNKRCRLLRLMG
jgi:hypothetical protein